MRTKTIHNATTGEIVTRPYTPAEESAADARDAAEDDRIAAAEAAELEAPLDAEELYDILATKGILLPQDRPRPKKVK